MNLNLITLNTKGRVDFDGMPDLSSCKDDRIISVENIRAKGFIIDNGTEDYEVNIEITGLLYLKSAINESPVPYKIDVNYADFVNNLVENYKNSSNSLDILPIIWENILLEIPIRVVNDDDEFESVTGEGWEILDNDE